MTFRRAARSLMYRPGLSCLAVATLALGIGANTAIFSVINAVLLKPLPFSDPAAFWTFPNGDVNLTGGAEPRRVSVARISPGFFEVLGVAPLYGRTFTEEETLAGNHRRAILSYGLWRGDFGGDPTLVGRDVMVNGLPYTVVGIMPPELQSRAVRILATDVQLWRPIVPEDNQTGGRGARRLRIVGRLAAGATVQQAEAELAGITSHLAETYPDTNRGTGIRLTPLREQVVRDVRRALLFLLASVAVVLIGACANVANLLLIKTNASRRRMALQQALGASRWRMAGEVLAEGALLGGIAAILGTVIAYAGVRTFVGLGPADIPLLADAQIDRTVLAFTLVASALTALLVGAFPAWRSSRPDLMGTLRQGTSQSQSPGEARTMANLTVAQIAVAVVLVTAGGVLIRSFQSMLRVDPGLDSSLVLTFQLELPMATTYPTQEARSTFFATLMERLRSLQGVRAVTMAGAPPFEDEPDERWATSFRRPGVDETVRANVQVVDAQYFPVLRIPTLEGRTFDRSDGAKAPRTAIINATLARSVWKGDTPIGARIELPFGGEATVVGVVGDVRARGLDREVGHTVYLAAPQYGYNFMTLIMKRERDAEPTPAVVQAVVREMDPNLPLHRVRTLEELVATSVAQQRFHMLLIGALSLLIFVVAILGTYGVTAYGVSERSSELALRVALGAPRNRIRGLVLRQGTRLALLGVAVGSFVAVGFSTLLTRSVPGVSTNDPVALVTAPILLAASVVLATDIPARRATRVDPMQVLRSD